MTQSPVMTPSQKVSCIGENCDKVYASKGNMMIHFKKSHKANNEIQSPLGRFPPSNPARVLFSDESQPSTQGNSHGDVNSPKVVSEGQYICGICEKVFESERLVNNHKKDSHVQENTELGDALSNDFVAKA